MEVIQFSDAVSKMAKPKQMPKITTEQREQWTNNASFRFYNAVREVNKNLKRKYRIDQVGSLIRDSIFIAVDIITDKDFEIIDMHTIKCKRTTINAMKRLRERADKINNACGYDDNRNTRNAPCTVLRYCAWFLSESSKAEFEK